jgi:lysophospholipase L1-like esterase
VAVVRVRAALKNLAKSLFATFVFFLLIESLLRVVYFARNRFADYVPLPYSIEDEYGPTPPWLDGLRVVQRDDALIWKLRPNLTRKYVDLFSPVPSEEVRRELLRQFFPRLPDYLKNNPAWEISLNSQGFRDGEFAMPKPPGTFRIICLGDSWTFGANVGQDETYPQRLQALLRRAYPKRKIEVLNLGVLGYSSFQGRELLRQTALQLQPDAVVLAYAWNDASLAGFHDSEMPGFKTSRVERLVAWFSLNAESFKLFRYFLSLAIYRPVSLADKLKKAAESEPSDESTDYQKYKQWTRVPLADYETNMREMIALARDRGASVILLYNAILRAPYRDAIQGISRAEHIPLVDGYALVAESQKQMEREIETKLALRQAGETGRADADQVEVIFRVYAGNHAVPKAIYIAGNHRELGDATPNKISMYDDGTHGDERAGDGVWSLAATFAPGTKLYYVYTNSGLEGRWQGLDVPAIRSFTVGTTPKLYRPIESFGQLYMHADNWHTNAAGYQLIARALFEVLKQAPRFETGTSVLPSHREN